MCIFPLELESYVLPLLWWLCRLYSCTGRLRIYMVNCNRSISIIPLVVRPRSARRSYNISAAIIMMTSSNRNISRVTGPLSGEISGSDEFLAQRPLTRSFDVFFDLNKRLSKQPWGWWFETPSWSLWRQCNDEKWHVFGEKAFDSNAPLTKFEDYVPDLVINAVPSDGLVQLKR